MSMFTIIWSFFKIRILSVLSREIILNIQEKKFRKILKYAYKKSKFYHDLYNSYGIIEKDLEKIDFNKIPTVNKETIIDNLDQVLTVDDVSKKEILDFLDKSKNPNDLLKNKYHIIHSSGSSGKLGLFVYSRKEWDTVYPYITKLYNFRFRKNKSVFIGASGGHFAGVSFSSWGSKGLPGFFNKPLIINVNEPIDDIIKKLNNFKPNILGGYFNALKILAQKKEEGILKINPHTLVNCGEGINKKDKNFIEKVFNTSMNNLYSFAECISLGFGKDEYEGIYLFDDLAKIEVKNDYILVTNLFNKTQPIIRYRVDDYVTLKDDKKKIYPFTLISDIIGRVESIIWFENNESKMDYIHPLIFTDFYVNGLDKHQLIIKSKTDFEFRAVIKSKKHEEVKKQIAEKLDLILLEKNFSNVKYTIKQVKEIPIDKKTGKFKLIVTKG